MKRGALFPWIVGAGGALALYLVFGASARQRVGPDKNKTRSPGDEAREGDVVDVDPRALAGLFALPAGALALVVEVTAASPTLLTGRVVGVSTGQGTEGTPVGPFGPYSFPRASVTAVRHRRVA